MASDTNSTRSANQRVSPILGLPVDDEPVRVVGSAVVDDADEARPELSVIVPARNEAANLGACLDSLVGQSDEFFKLGRDWELIVVDDDSADETRAIAERYAGVTVIAAPELELRGAQRAFTGKTNACWAGAQKARGKWFLFTDADTVHEPGNMVRAMHEAKKHAVSLLSYSPKQVVHGFWQRALMPLIFSELASVYPTAQVNDPAKKVAAANGQFLMAERQAYFAVGGHRMVGRSVLEDVDLAVNMKRAAVKSGRGIWLRYAPDAVSARMYRGVLDMMEGWTKNLALLFPHALKLAAWRFLDILLLLLPLLLLEFPHWETWKRVAILALWARNLLRFYTRVGRSNFGFLNCAVSVLALPLFITLLVRSWMDHRLFHRVGWKGREYTT